MDKTLENLCRLCGDERCSSFNVFIKSEDDIVVADVIRNILNISISLNDTIPKEICADCNTFLVNFVKFKDTAEKTQLFLADLELNLEKEKKSAHSERKDSMESVKSEPYMVLKDDVLEASRLSFSSDDEIYPLVQAALQDSQSSQHQFENTHQTLVHNDDRSQEAPSNHSFSWDDENVPLIDVVRENSSKKMPRKRLKNSPQKQLSDSDEFVNQMQHGEDLNNRRSVDPSTENPLDNPEECNICQKQFTKERYLRHHLRLTHKIFIESKYPCNRCTRKFMQKLSWERHLKLHDDPNFNRPVACDICGKFYINKQTLKAHIRSIHMDNRKKFVCEECGAQFKSISSLKVHQITHTGEYPFECTKCDRKFQSKANLFVHLDTHTETPYLCHICQKPSTTLRGLRLHMVNHSEDKPHKCHMCNNAYKRVTALKKHLIVHSGIKPYSCNFCERTFADGSNKRIHMKRVHKKELASMEASGWKVVPAVLPKIQQLREDGVTIIEG